MCGQRVMVVIHGSFHMMVLISMYLMINKCTFIHWVSSLSPMFWKYSDLSKNIFHFDDFNQ